MIVKLRVILGNLRFKLSAAQQPCACAASPVTRDARNILPLTTAEDSSSSGRPRSADRWTAAISGRYKEIFQFYAPPTGGGRGTCDSRR